MHICTYKYINIYINFVIIFQKLFDVIWFCKNLFISKFSLKMTAAETRR